jgi:uncharacterized damage-inducible protein DinB
MAITGTEYAQSFSMHREALLGLLEQIPAEQGEFTAWPEGMSFRRLADHLSASSGRVSAMTSGQIPQKLEPSADLAAAVERLREATHSTKLALTGLTPEVLAKVVPAFGQEMPVRGMIDFMLAHEAHHKGQVWMMARMIGVQPPMFVKI